MKKSLIFVMIFSSCAMTQKHAKNAILFIGDGMGGAQITGARLLKGGSTSSLNLEKMEYTGYSKTYSSNDFTTDSAASATAMATGVKTYNGAVGMTDPKVDPSGKSRNLQTIVDLAAREGKWVGIVTTTRVTHATPAAFYAHVPIRAQEEEIAQQLQLHDGELKLLLGGGRGKFKDEDIDLLKTKGWSYVQKKDQLLKSLKANKVLGLFSNGHLSFDLLKKKDEPSLKELVSFAIKFLSRSPNGYILIVEGGRIDHAAHYNYAGMTFSEVIAFDDALGEAWSLVDRGQTLLLLTADHETGGLSLSGYGDINKIKGEALLRNLNTSYSKYNKKHPIVVWGTGPGAKSPQFVPEMKNPYRFQHRGTYYHEQASHTPVDVIVGASGPGAEKFSGFMNNSDIPIRLNDALGLSFDSPVNLENRRAQNKEKK